MSKKSYYNCLDDSSSSSDLSTSTSSCTSSDITITPRDTGVPFYYDDYYNPVESNLDKLQKILQVINGFTNLNTSTTKIVKVISGTDAHSMTDTDEIKEIKINTSAFGAMASTEQRDLLTMLSTILSKINTSTGVLTVKTLHDTLSKGSKFKITT